MSRPCPSTCPADLAWVCASAASSVFVGPARGVVGSSTHALSRPRAALFDHYVSQRGHQPRRAHRWPCSLPTEPERQVRLACCSSTNATPGRRARLGGVDGSWRLPPQPGRVDALSAG